MDQLTRASFSHIDYLLVWSGHAESTGGCVCIYGQQFQQSMYQLGNKVANPAR